MSSLDLTMSGHDTPSSIHFAEVRALIQYSPTFFSLAFKRQVNRPFDALFAESSNLPECIPWNRLTHTVSVIEHAAWLAQELGYDVDLACAGAAGHDCGHVAKGHYGEQWVKRVLKLPFYHEAYSLTALRNVAGIDIPEDVAKCIVMHSFSSGVMERTDLPEECRIVALADKAAYVLDDAFEARHLLWTGGYEHRRYGWQTRKTLIAELDNLLHELYPHFKPFTYIPRKRNLYTVPYSTATRWRRERRLGDQAITALRRQVGSHVRHAIAEESQSAGRVCFSCSPTAQHFMALRQWLMEHIYHGAEDEERENREMAAAYEFVLQYFPKHDPVPVFLLLHDVHVRRAAALIDNSIPALPRYKDTVSELMMDITREDFGAELARIQTLESIDVCAVPDWYFAPSS